MESNPLRAINKKYIVIGCIAVIVLAVWIVARFTILDKPPAPAAAPTVEVSEPERPLPKVRRVMFSEIAGTSYPEALAKIGPFTKLVQEVRGATPTVIPLAPFATGGDVEGVSRDDLTVLAVCLGTDSPPTLYFGVAPTRSVNSEVKSIVATNGYVSELSRTVGCPLMNDDQKADVPVGVNVYE